MSKSDIRLDSLKEAPYLLDVWRIYNNTYFKGLQKNGWLFKKAFFLQNQTSNLSHLKFFPQKLNLETNQTLLLSNELS